MDVQMSPPVIFCFFTMANIIVKDKEYWNILLQLLTTESMFLFTFSVKCLGRYYGHIQVNILTGLLIFRRGELTPSRMATFKGTKERKMQMQRWKDRYYLLIDDYFISCTKVFMIYTVYISISRPSARKYKITEVYTALLQCRKGKELVYILLKQNKWK